MQALLRCPTCSRRPVGPAVARAPHPCKRTNWRSAWHAPGCRARHGSCRVQAAPDLSAGVTGALAVIGSLGIVGGTLFASLWIIEKQSVAAIAKKVERLEARLAESKAELVAAEQKMVKAQEYAKENDLYRARYADAARDNLKLERALEMKDGQLETFMVVARRQIKYLEDIIKELRLTD